MTSVLPIRRIAPRLPAGDSRLKMNGLNIDLAEPWCGEPTLKRRRLWTAER